MAVVSRHPAKASRSASMTVKATAHSVSEPPVAAWLGRSLCSSPAFTFQPSTRIGSRILLADADDKQKLSTMSAEVPSAHGPEQSRHSVHVTECRDCASRGHLDIRSASVGRADRQHPIG